VKKAGYEIADLSKETPLPDQIEAIFGEREVDCGVDCVGFEAHGHGAASGDEDPTAVLNGLFAVVRAGGGMGIPGIYTAGDPEAKTEAVKQGAYNLDFGKAWIKSPSLTGGQAPVVKYSRDLMMAILWDRMPYLSEVMNIEVVPLEKAPEAYRAFDDGSPKKFVLDPHGSVRG
jgi:glutathione-independent formaldehyde dehydrogenase